MSSASDVCSVFIVFIERMDYRISQYCHKSNKKCFFVKYIFKTDLILNPSERRDFFVDQSEPIVLEHRLGLVMFPLSERFRTVPKIFRMILDVSAQEDDGECERYTRHSSPMIVFVQIHSFSPLNNSDDEYIRISIKKSTKAYKKY